MTDNNNDGPTARVTRGELSVSIFRNLGRHGTFYNASPIQRAYRDENQEIKYSSSLRQSDMQPARKLLDQVDDKMEALRQEDRAKSMKADRQQSSEPSNDMEP